MVFAMGCQERGPSSFDLLADLLEASPGDPEIRFLCANQLGPEGLETLAAEHPEPVFVAAWVAELAEGGLGFGLDSEEMCARLVEACRRWEAVDPENGCPLVVRASVELVQGRIGAALELAEAASRKARIDDLSAEASRRVAEILRSRGLDDVGLLLEVPRDHGSLLHLPLMDVAEALGAAGDEALHRGAAERAESHYEVQSRLSVLYETSVWNLLGELVLGVVRWQALSGQFELALARGEHERAREYAARLSELARLLESSQRLGKRAAERDPWVRANEVGPDLPGLFDPATAKGAGRELAEAFADPERARREIRAEIERNLRRDPGGVRASLGAILSGGERAAFDRYLTEADRRAIGAVRADEEWLAEQVQRLYPSPYVPGQHRGYLLGLAFAPEIRGDHEARRRVMFRRSAALDALTHHNDTGAVAELRAHWEARSWAPDIAFSLFALGDRGADLVDEILFQYGHPGRCAERVRVIAELAARDRVGELLEELEYSWQNDRWRCAVPACFALGDVTGEDHGLDVSAWLAWGAERAPR